LIAKLLINFLIRGVPMSLNSFDDLICEVYCALEKGSRELIGLIPSVNLDACASRAAIGQIIRSPVVPQSIAFDVVAGINPPNVGAQVIGSDTMVINKFRAVALQWTGEEIRSLDNCIGYPNIRQRQIQEAIRTLTNEMERDIAAQWIYATGSVGPDNPAGLFADNNYRDVANVRKLLVDSGAPLDDLHLVLSTRAGAQLRGNAQYVGCDTACTDSILRQGILMDVHGMQIRESAQIVQGVTAGTGALATTNAAGYAVGTTVITLASAGTGTILAGDNITFAGDPNVYTVAIGDADVSGGGTITLTSGLLVAIPAAATAITVALDSGEKNMAFSRDAIVLAVRAPAMPPECAQDFALVTDPMSGLTFQVSQWCQYYQVHYEISAVWGVKTFNPNHLKLLTQ
jgi:hypothetical protein